MHTSLTVFNVKCSGCSKCIIRKLNEVEGITNPVVNKDDGIVEFDAINEGVVITAKQILTKSGYPESTPTLTQTAKSYISCISGRLSQ